MGTPGQWILAFIIWLTVVVLVCEIKGEYFTHRPFTQEEIEAMHKEMLGCANKREARRVLKRYRKRTKV